MLVKFKANNCLLKWIYLNVLFIIFPVVIWCVHQSFRRNCFFFRQVPLGQKKSIECFCWVCRSWVRETGAGYPETLLFPGPQLKWQAMLRSTLLDRPTHQDERGGQACSTWSQKWYTVFLLLLYYRWRIFTIDLHPNICFPLQPMDESPAAVEQFTLQNTQDEATSSNQLPTLHLGQQKKAEFAKQLPTFQLSQHEESGYTEPTLPLPDLELNSSIPCKTIPVPMPAFYPALVPAPLTLWPPSFAHVEEAGTAHEILKPTPLNGKEVVKADDVVGMSKLSIGEASSVSMEPTALSLQLIGSTDARQSAFHVSPPINRPELSKRNSSPIHAVWRSME